MIFSYLFGVNRWWVWGMQHIYVIESKTYMFMDIHVWQCYSSRVCIVAHEYSNTQCNRSMETRKQLIARTKKLWNVEKQNQHVITVWCKSEVGRGTATYIWKHILTWAIMPDHAMHTTGTCQHMNTFVCIAVVTCEHINIKKLQTK